MSYAFVGVNTGTSTLLLGSTPSTRIFCVVQCDDFALLLLACDPKSDDVYYMLLILYIY